MSAAGKIDEYLNTLSLSNRTRASYRSVLLAFARWMREHDYYTIGTAVRYYGLDLKRRGSAKKETIATYERIVKAFGRWLAESEGSSGYDTARSDCSRGLARNPPLAIDASDLKSMCALARRRGEAGLRGRAMLLLAVTCSLNPEQIAAIMPGDAMIDEFGGRVRVPKLGGEGKIEIEMTGAARTAIVEYLTERGPVPAGLPLVAVTTTRGNRQAMSPSDVRKCLAKILELLAYDYLEAFNGDCERLVASYIGRLGESGRQELAAHAARLYYDESGLL